MKTTFLKAALFWLLTAGAALAQSNCPSIITGAVLTAAQWQSCFAAKQNTLGYVPLSTAGGTLSGRLSTVASAAANAGLNIPAGAAPTSPVNGDVWTTTGGVFVRINGSTVGPLASSAVTTLSVVTANGFAGTVANPGTTPAVTITTSVNGIAKGNGTGLSAATGADLPSCTSSVGGAVPTPPNNVTTFLRGDCSWAAPVGGVVNAQTGTTYTFAVSDCGGFVTASNASANTYTVDTNANKAYSANCQIYVAQIGAGKTTIASPGVTVNSISGNKAASAQYGVMILKRLSTDNWLLSGNIGP